MEETVNISAIYTWNYLQQLNDKLFLSRSTLKLILK